MRKREGSLRALVHAALARHPEASMVGIVRTFPMTWWSTWACIILTGSLGVVYLMSSLTRFSSPAFATAKRLLANGLIEPMYLWGVVFVVISVAEILAIRASLRATRLLLRLGATTYLFYAVLFFLSALDDNRASFGGTLLYLFVAVIHLAAAETIALISRETRTT